MCLAEYLNLFFQTQVGKDLLLLSSPGSAGRNRTLNQEMLLGCRVPAPPIADQRRIVDLIEAVDGVTLAAEREALAAIQIAASHETDFCSLAENAEHTTLEAIADVVGGITKDKKKEEAGTGFVEVPYLRVANVQRGFLDLSTLTSIKVSAAAAERLRLQHGDVLMNEGGDRDKLGRGWIWEDQVADCVHQNHVFRARINDEGFEPRFVSLWANTYGQRWFFENGGQTTGIASISMSTLKRFPVPRLPLSRQAEIVAMSEAARQAEDRARSVAETARGLRSVLLSELLSGKHQIPRSYDALLVPA
jgi:type I restriction enzyme S subunit